MDILRWKTPSVQIGDRFIKTGDRIRKVWEVSRLWTAVDNVPHARLVSKDETLIASVRTLADQKFFIHAPSGTNE